MRKLYFIEFCPVKTVRSHTEQDRGEKDATISELILLKTEENRISLHVIVLKPPVIFIIIQICYIRGRNQ
jgi:hypothetical protein